MFFKLKISYFFWLVLRLRWTHALSKIHTTPYLTNPERTVMEGYTSESHSVVTEDGYVLLLHRIPHGRADPDVSGSRPVVLLMHGSFGSSDDWVKISKGKALAFILADDGYDVWMGNARGNRYSRNHRTLSPRSKRFWNFSWNEVGLYDISSSIEFILSKTGQQHLTYVGYSSGAGVVLVLLSERPEYNSKINVAAFLAPAAFRTNARTLLYQASAAHRLIEKLGNLLTKGRLTLQSKFWNGLTTTLCTPNNPELNPICRKGLLPLFDIDADLVPQEILPSVFSTTPSGGSLRSLIHWMQVKEADSFQKYDFGFLKNLLEYGSIRPTKYNLKNVAIPVGIFIGPDDRFVPPEDALRLARELPNVVLYYTVSDPRFGHSDFLWARDVDVLIYNKVVELLDGFN